jgi:peptidoglycan/LPS O-acetylase OafA/YrhL
MDCFYFIFLIPVFISLYLSVKLINKIIPLSIVPIKHPEIDGLRGYLAFFVFLHHSYIWHTFLKTNKWEEPESNLFNQFGQTSVVLFFIITAFLFISKLIDKKTINFDWKNYIFARFFRMFPMYFFSVCFIFLIVAVESNFEIKDSILNIAKSTSSWLLFCINGSVDINTLENTYIINSGIAWTLPYEWMFYFLLPLLALSLKAKVNYKVLVTFTLAFLFILYINESSLKRFIPFLGGVFCALILNNKNLTHFKQSKYTYIAILLITLSICFFNRGRDFIPTLISTFLFLIISSGNSFFGILTMPFSRKFGQITYSLYLVHGIILYIIFRFIIGFENISKLTDIEYWGIISICLFLIIFISQITYKYIELPMMNFYKLKSKR